MITAALAMPTPVSWAIQGFVVLILGAVIVALAWPTGRQVRHATDEPADEPTGPALRDQTRTDDVGYDATEEVWRS